MSATTDYVDTGLLTGDDVTAIGDTTDSEIGLIACALRTASEFGTNLPDDTFAHITGAMMSNNACGTVWDAIAELHTSGQAVDPIAVMSALRSDTTPPIGEDGQPIRPADGLDQRGKLNDSTRVVINRAVNSQYFHAVSTYVDEITRGHHQRQVRQALLGGWQRLAHDPNEAIEWVSARLSDADALATNDVFDHDSRDDIDNFQQHQQREIRSISTPWPKLTTMLDGGCQPGTVTLFGARPGEGKSMSVLAYAADAAYGGWHTQVISLEMPRAQVTGRILARKAHVPLREIKQRRYSPGNKEALDEEMDRYAALGTIWSNDASYMTLERIVRVARARDKQLRHQAKNALVAAGATVEEARAADARGELRGLEVLVVDYVQIVDPSDPRKSPHESLGEITRGLKRLAIELDLVVIAAAQVNRDGNDEPSLKNLRSSGSLENDADNVVLIHRQPVPEGGDVEIQYITFNLAKHREGETGSIELISEAEFADIADSTTHGDAGGSFDTTPGTHP